jgi:hypothetical protein
MDIVLSSERPGKGKKCKKGNFYPNCINGLRYEKNGLESAFGTKKKHILKNN